jgi:TctA family transporter
MAGKRIGTDAPWSMSPAGLDGAGFARRRCPLRAGAGGRNAAAGGETPSPAGVAAPEAANNAAAQSSFVTLFGLGLPANAATAVLIGAMMLHGLPPGPVLFTAQPALLWTFIGSLMVANLHAGGDWLMGAAAPGVLAVAAAALVLMVAMQRLSRHGA